MRLITLLKYRRLYEVAMETGEKIHEKEGEFSIIFAGKLWNWICQLVPNQEWTCGRICVVVFFETRGYVFEEKGYCWWWCNNWITTDSPWITSWWRRNTFLCLSEYVKSDAAYTEWLNSQESARIFWSVVTNMFVQWCCGTILLSVFPDRQVEVNSHIVKMLPVFNYSATFKKEKEQDSIPVGYVPPAFVVSGIWSKGARSWGCGTTPCEQTTTCKKLPSCNFVCERKKINVRLWKSQMRDGLCWSSLCICMRCVCCVCALEFMLNWHQTADVKQWHCFPLSLLRFMEIKLKPSYCKNFDNMTNSNKANCTEIAVSFCIEAAF